MEVSIIIPTYNKLTRLRLTLESIKYQTMDPKDFELIIIDDGSTDGTMEYITSWSREVPFCVKQVRSNNYGRAASRNKGINLATGTYIVFSDDDLIWPPSYLKEYLKCMIHESHQTIAHGYIFNLSLVKFLGDPADASSVIGGPRRSRTFESVVITEKDIANHFESKIKKLGRITRFEKGVRFVLSAYRNLEWIQWIAFTGGNVCLRRDLLIEVGGFDENFGLFWGCEDLELGYRLYLKGCKFIACENAASYHLAHFRSDHQNQHDHSFTYFCNKHKSPIIAELRKFLNDQEVISEYIDRMNLIRKQGGKSW
ncbi:glycosyltransferase family 2 protein [Bacillus cereus]|uniref:glycosyltransferase family 2 protein n=1 Tax=Bacillus cereus TaxID=1396 RepID=UPI00065BA1B7|nr:glycosyltransferase [Bacillus cereus]KMQ32188.1 hypothetical protein TU58_01500 [Bacillus cereus]